MTQNKFSRINSLHKEMKNKVDKKERRMRDSQTGGRKDARRFFPSQAPHISFKSFPRRSQAGFVWLSVDLLFSLKTRGDVLASIRLSLRASTCTSIF